MLYIHTYDRVHPFKKVYASKTIVYYFGIISAVGKLWLPLLIFYFGNMDVCI